MAHQPSLPGIPPPKRSTDITNVASVPQRSPFRYPGGKTCYPHIRRWRAATTAGGAIDQLWAAIVGLDGCDDYWRSTSLVER
jgi:hypothetical protein